MVRITDAPTTVDKLGTAFRPIRIGSEPCLHCARMPTSLPPDEPDADVVDGEQVAA